MFKFPGNQGHGWSKAYVFIGQQDSYTVDIKATIGKSPNARIAFDDIAMLHCHDTAPAACSDFEFKCSTSTMCIPGEKKCNGIQDCSDGSDEQGCRKYLLTYLVIFFLRLRTGTRLTRLGNRGNHSN